MDWGLTEVEKYNAQTLHANATHVLRTSAITMQLQAIIASLEEATQNMPGKINADTQLAGIEGWDSMGVVSFVQIIFEQSRIELDAEALATCRTVSELHDLLTKQRK
jgi:acyl carrier protein